MVNPLCMKYPSKRSQVDGDVQGCNLRKHQELLPISCQLWPKWTNGLYNAAFRQSILPQ